MPPPSNRDNQLRLFIAVARASSLREASEVLGITQPALSKQIRALEEALGKQLFLRHGRGMQLTPDGQALFLQIDPLFQSLDAAVAQSAGGIRHHGGTLRIATVHTLVPYFIPALSQQLLERYPGTHLTIHCDSSSNVVESIERGKADVGFVYETAVAAPDMNSLLLFEERLALYLRTNSATEDVAHANLASMRLILPPKPYALRRVVERALGYTVQPYIECDSLELCLRLVAVTAGVTVLPDGIPIDMVEDRGLRRQLLPSIASRRLVAISRLKRGYSPALDAALDIAVAVGASAPITWG